MCSVVLVTSYIHIISSDVNVSLKTASLTNKRTSLTKKADQFEQSENSRVKWQTVDLFRFGLMGSDSCHYGTLKLFKQSINHKS